VKILTRVAIAIMICTLHVVSVAQGVKFEATDAKWADLLAKAKTENKVIFMDAYTTWCGPCKMMTRNIFPDAEVGSFYNTNFVNVKMDMEKGEGIELARKYAVAAYPTLLFITPEGDVVHRVAGYHDVPGFLALGKQAANPEMTMVGMDKKYAAGARDPEFIMSYLTSKADAMDPAYSTIANDFLRTQGDYGTERNMNIIMRFIDDPFSDGFNYLLKNKPVFEKKFGVEALAEKIQNSVAAYFDANPNLTLGDTEKVFKKVFGADGDRLFSGYKPSFYRNKGDKDGYAQATVAHFKNYPSKDPQELNEAAWTFFRVVEDPKMLKSAAKWAKKSIKIDNQYYNNDTLAALLFKAGKLKPARKAAEKAIAIAKKNNEDYSETQKLLDQVVAKMGS
jgi:thioredoxin-related protein